ncbi:MAG: UDP-glucose/GDP-mannose dehydrogenase family protein [Muribaculaceae bacterium]|nr:UDP-glucose/GDP-mannose dehydrogenase family protein [Muribaculaceae bacterium]
MDIAIVGTGYVGLVTGTCFAESGTNVTCIDINEEKIESLKKGIMPIYEPGLRELAIRNMDLGRLKFSTRLVDVLDDVDIVFSAVGTPSDEDGSADLKYVLDVARTIGQNMNKHLVVVTKSTVPVGTAKKVRNTIQSELDKRGVNIQFDVASNPEFLKEGAAIKDFMSPERVVIGTDSETAEALMARLYKPFMLNSYRVIFMDVASAEMTKYAANAMLATRISFMNEIANLCEKVGANVSQVRKGIASDSRIGSKFLYPGCGYGGSCFPKDVKALIHTAHENDCSLHVVEAVEAVNEKQKHILFKKLVGHYGDISKLKGQRIAVWGLSFKPETDDLREAPSLILIDELLSAGCKVKVYDPISMPEVKPKLGDSVEYSKDMYDAVLDADALIIVTEWKEFRVPAWGVIAKAMQGNVIIDGRNIYDAKELKENKFIYYMIGKKID